MKTSMRLVMAMATMVVAMVPASMKAQGYGQVPGPHPAYLHALSDLRAARHYLHDDWSWGAVQRDDDMADSSDRCSDQ